LEAAEKTPMNIVVLAISIAYVVMAVLLLCMGLTSRYAWWIKACVIVITSAFFIESFFATRSLLGWPGPGPLPHRFQVLWTRVVEPDPKLGDSGAVYLWVEELDENSVPSGTPRSFKLRYSTPLADKSTRARDEIMAGNPQEGTAEGVEDGDTNQADARSSRANGVIRPEEAERFDGDGNPLRNAETATFRALQHPVPVRKD
jgi:hypothetical protein